MYKNARILNFFDFHLEFSMYLAFVWDIPKLPIRYNWETIKKKQVLVPQDYTDRTNPKTSKYSFPELGVDYEYRNPVRTINSIVEKLSENHVQTILLLDEIIPDSDSSGSSSEQFSLEELNSSKRNVHLLLAINPAWSYKVGL